MVARTFGIPDGWRLVSQMVFGRIVEAPGPKERTPGDEAVLVGHATEGPE